MDENKSNFNKRKTISKKLRFEVFKRDSFKCQYCGSTSPDVILEVDHIIPIKEGGDNDITNLITACNKCNRGKGARLLSDDSAIKKQKKQLDELNKRREQLEMMLKWKQELLKLEDKSFESIKNIWEKKTCCKLTDYGISNLKILIKKYPINIILDAIDASVKQYLLPSNDGFTRDSIEKAFKYISKICHIKTIEIEKPYLRDLFYIRGILRNKFNYLDEPYALKLLEKAYLNGISINRLKEIAMEAYRWRDWLDDMWDLGA